MVFTINNNEFSTNHKIVETKVNTTKKKKWLFNNTNFIKDITTFISRIKGNRIEL